MSFYVRKVLDSGAVFDLGTYATKEDAIENCSCINGYGVYDSFTGKLVYPTDTSSIKKITPKNEDQKYKTMWEELHMALENKKDGLKNMNDEYAMYSVIYRDAYDKVINMMKELKKNN